MGGPRWGRSVAATIAAGMVAAVALGKVAPVSLDLEKAFGLSPFWLGVTISAVTLTTAVFAVPLGHRLRRSDPRLWLVGGLAVMGVAGSLMAISAPNATLMICLRIVEGLGYLLVMVGGPVVLWARTPAGRLPFVLAWWATCVPAGLAISALAGGLLQPRVGWSGWFLSHAIACAALAIATALAGRGARASGSGGPRVPVRTGGWNRFKGAFLLSTGFSAVALVGVAVTSLLPSYLGTDRGLTVTDAGAITSVVAIASVPGSGVAGVLLGRRVRPRTLAAVSLLCPLLAFVTFAGFVPLPLAIAGAVALLFTVGVAVGAAYGALPLVVGAVDDLPPANAMFVQLGSLGTLVAPPIFAVATGLSRWNVATLLVLGAVVSGVLLIAAATRKEFHVTSQPVTPV